MRRKAIITNPKDNVATALTDLEVGDFVEIEIDKDIISTTLLDSIPLGHKFSIANVKAGSLIMKYGESIGEAIADIRAGQHVHVHNICSTRAGGVAEKSEED